MTMVRTFFKAVTVADPDYLAWIRRQPCLICRSASEAHHQNRRGHGAKGARCDDRRALPLCWKHHTGGGDSLRPGSYHGQARVTGWLFWERYRIDPEAEIVRFNAAYVKQGGVLRVA